MRYATACVVCTGAFETKGRSDRRYCGDDCRVRAHRIRADGGGRLRSDAQRREVREVRAVLRETQEATADHTRRLREATEWAALLEAETEKQRLEIERLQWTLLEAEEGSVQSDAARSRRLAEAKAAAHAAQEQATQQTAARATVEALLITAQQEAHTHRAAAVKHTQRCKAKEEENAQLEAVCKKQRKEIAALRADDVQIGKARHELHQTRQKLQEASTLNTELRASEEQSAKRRAELHKGPTETRGSYQGDQ